MAPNSQAEVLIPSEGVHSGAFGRELGLDEVMSVKPP